MRLQANTEAEALGNARVQIAELQAVLAGMNQQMLAEQAMRRADAQVRPWCRWTGCVGLAG